MPSWHLQDADELAVANKYPFFKSTRESIAKVRPGETVKLIFGFDSDPPGTRDAERMWVIVDTIEPAGRFTGRLGNDPAWITDLKAGDTLAFAACHVINTEHDDRDNLVARYIKRCFVTNRILRDGQRVGHLYREAPDNDRDSDSGWRIMANDESAEYMHDAANIAFVSLGAVRSYDDSFIHLLGSPEGARFERAPGADAFVPLEPYAHDDNDDEE